MMRIRQGSAAAGIVLAALFVGQMVHTDAARSQTGPTLSVVSEDPYANRNTFHRTEAEPDSFTDGSTVVAAFQVGRAHTCGASNLGWSVSRDAGRTWTDGFLPPTTVRATPPGPWIRTTDPVVAYDAKHDTWLAAGLGFANCHESAAVFVSRSTDGARTFDEPIIVEPSTPSDQLGRDSIACDNYSTSPYFGHCYMQWDDEAHNLRLEMATSTDGGLAWKRAAIREETHVIDGQPLVQPDGTVVMPIDQCCPTRIDAFISTDGGRTFSGHGTNYSGPLAIRGVRASNVRGNLIMSVEAPNISADIDASGRIYVVWPDCRFRRDCSQNDVVMSTTTDGRRWSSVVRIPIDDRASFVDHFLPVVAVDPATSGASAHIAILYYFYPDADCTVETCELSVGFVSSTDGGATWASQQLAGPFKNTWLPLKRDGYFVGDYFSVSFVSGNAIAVFTVASEGACELGDITSCNTWESSATIPVGS
jgi:hypothetical protein